MAAARTTSSARPRANSSLHKNKSDRSTGRCSRRSPHGRRTAKQAHGRAVASCTIRLRTAIQAVPSGFTSQVHSDPVENLDHVLQVLQGADARPCCRPGAALTSINSPGLKGFGTFFLAATGRDLLLRDLHQAGDARTRPDHDCRAPCALRRRALPGRPRRPYG